MSPFDRATHRGFLPPKRRARQKQGAIGIAAQGAGPPHLLPLPLTDGTTHVRIPSYGERENNCH
jgi:hypothetical protein